MAREDIVIISPGLLEAGTNRGGGIEEVDYQIGNLLCKYYTTKILSPYYKVYCREKVIKNNLSLIYIPFPAIWYYPPRSPFENILTFFITNIYSFFLLIYLLADIYDKSRLIIVHNGLPGLMATLVGRLRNKKILFFEGNTSPWIKPFIVSIKPPLKIGIIQDIGYHINLTTGKAICNLSHKIITQSDQIRTGMISVGKINPQKISVIPIGVDNKAFKPLSNDTSNNKNIKIGFIGRLTEEKGVLLLIDLIKRAQIQLPETRFIVLGDGPYKKQLLSYSNVEKCCKVPRNELSSWLSKMHIAIFFQKELGLAELEAMASGKALVACDTKEVSRVIKHGENGLLCSPNIESYMKSINLLCNDYSLRQKLSLNARNTTIKYFDWNVICLKWFSECKRFLRDE